MSEKGMLMQNSINRIATRYYEKEFQVVEYLRRQLPTFTVRATAKRDQFAVFDGELLNPSGEVVRVFEIKSRDNPHQWFEQRGSFLMDALKFDRLMQLSQEKQCVASFYNITSDDYLYCLKFAKRGRLLVEIERKILDCPLNSWSKQQKRPKKVVLLPLGIRVN